MLCNNKEIIMNKKKALYRANKLLNQVHKLAQEEERSFLTLRKKPFAELSFDCLNLKEKIIAESENSGTLLVDQKSVEDKLMSLERKLARLQGKTRWRLGIQLKVGCGVAE
jgi:hypothetical protein